MRKKKISKSSKLKCAFCQGKGVQPGAERLSCIVCGGSGRITAKQPYSICKECEGGGRKQGANLYCLSCHGKGFVEEKRYPQIAKSPVSMARKRGVKKGRKGKFSKRKRARKPVRKKRGKKSAKPK
ncbi:MAG: hypothetical protein AABX74_06685, partial [Nanoarchaeota archaeon]